MTAKNMLAWIAAMLSVGLIPCLNHSGHAASPGALEVRTLPPTPNVGSISATGDFGYDAVVQPDGKIVAVGGGNPNTPAILLASNNDWGAPLTSCPSPIVACGTPQDILNTGMSADSYAPSNPNRGLDSALLLTLPPDTFTATLRGVNNGTGVGLIGVDEIVPQDHWLWQMSEVRAGGNRCGS